MKRWLFPALILLSACATEDQSKNAMAEHDAGVKFVYGSFSEAQQMATAEEKMIIMDVYADWCVPCKKLDKAVFKDAAVGDFVNARFVGLKIDGEKGEGPDIMKKYGIPGYPTVILMDTEGNEIDRIVGFGEKEAYVETLKDYVSGKGTLADYLARLAEKPDDWELHLALAEKYDDRQDLLTAAKHYQAVLDNAPAEEQEVRESSSFQLAICDLARENPQPLTTFLETSDNQGFIKRGAGSLARYYLKRDKPGEAFQAYETVLKRVPPDAGFLNAYAWRIFQSKQDSHYARGIELAEKAVALEPESDAIWDTLAQLRYANGDVKGAIEAMSKAASINPEESGYQKLLAEYQGKAAA